MTIGLITSVVTKRDNIIKMLSGLNSKGHFLFQSSLYSCKAVNKIGKAAAIG
jgi:hypothetical protein